MVNAYESEHWERGSSSAVGRQSSETEAEDPDLRKLPWPARPNLHVFFHSQSRLHAGLLHQAMDERPLPAIAYNCIPFLEQQSPAISDDLLTEFGRLLINYNLHQHWGLAKLHRHLELPPQHVMVHTRPSPSVDICRPSDLQDTQLSLLLPNSLLLNQDKLFQAYEYEVGVERLALDVNFLDDLRRLLLSHRLESHIALAKAAGPRLANSLETMLVDKNGMTCGTRLDPYKEKICGQTGENNLVTGWMFCQRGSGIEVVMVKKCVQDLSGLHTIVKDEISWPGL